MVKKKIRECKKKKPIIYKPECDHYFEATSDGFFTRAICHKCGKLGKI